MQLGKLYVLVLAYMLLITGIVEAKIKRGKITSEKDLVFLDSFFFLNTEDNVLDYTIKYPADQCCYRLVIFDESYGQWGGIRPNEDRLTCRNMIDRVTDLDYKIKLSTRDPACQMETDDAGFNWLVCHERINFASRQRPQSYFVHLANCRSNRKGFRNVTYEIHMTNGNNGLMKEFAENQKYMMETDLTFFLGYVAMTIFATRFRYVLSRKKLLHLTYRLFYNSLFLKTVCLLLLNIDLARFARTGLQMNTVQDIAEILSCLSSILFVSVLILVSKGFSITRAHVSLFGTVKMIVFGLLYAATYTVAFFDQRVLIDPRDIITSMTSLSASGVIAIKIVGCIVFVYGCLISMKNYPTKALFYIPFALFFTLWFMAEPIYRMVAFYVCPILRSPNIWNGIDLAFCFAGHAYFIFITRPDRLNKRFPFHLPAAKISFRDDDEDLDNPYQPADYFFSIFETDKKQKKNGKETALREEPDHFLTPVLPFNANSAECLVHVNGSISPSRSLPTVSGYVAVTMDAIATNPADTQPQTSPPPTSPPPTLPPPTTTPLTLPPPIGFVGKAQPNIKSAKASAKPLPTLKDIPKKDRTAVGVSTVAVPRGGFGIFSVQQLKDIPTFPKVSDREELKDIPTCPQVSGTEIPEHPKEKAHSGVKDTWTSPKDIPEQKQRKDCIVNQVRVDGHSFLSPVIQSAKSTVLPSIKTIEGSGSGFELSNSPSLSRVSPNVRIINFQPVKEPLQTSFAPQPATSGLEPISIKLKDTVSTPKLSAWTTESWKSMEIDRCQIPAPKIQNWTTVPLGPVEIGQSKSSPGLITSQPIKFQEPELPKINSTSQEGILKESLQDQELHGSPAPPTSLGPGSMEQEPELPKINSASREKTLKEGLQYHGPHSPPTCLTIGPRSLDQDCQPTADEGDFSKFHVPSPKILNWNTGPLGSADIEHSKSSPGLITSQPINVQEPELPKINIISQEETLKAHSHPSPPTSLTMGPRSLEQDCLPAADGGDFQKIDSTSQEETLKESLQDQRPHGPPAPPTSLTIGPRSLEQDSLPTADGGDSPKIGRKTQREPSNRRFSKPTKTDMGPETNPEVKAMDPKTKKKRLRRFLKLARKHKTNKLSQAD